MANATLPTLNFSAILTRQVVYRLVTLLETLGADDLFFVLSRASSPLWRGACTKLKGCLLLYLCMLFFHLLILGQFISGDYQGLAWALSRRQVGPPEFYCGSADSSAAPRCRPLV